MSDLPRFLGLAFASADVLFELDEDGRVAFAAGDPPNAGSPLSDWLGLEIADVVGRASHRVIRDALGALTAGGRTPPLEVLVRAGEGQVRRASLRAFILPEQAPRLSCALIWNGAAFQLDLPPAAPVADAGALLRHAETLMSRPMASGLLLAVVDAPGLAAAGAPEGARARQRIESALGAAADGPLAQLTPDRYALLSAAVSDSLTDVVREAAAAEGVALSPQAVSAAVPRGRDMDCALRAMRHALEQCLKAESLKATGASFQTTLDRTLEQAERFRATVRERRFALAFQPIVDLGTRANHHFEVLARFPGRDGPASTIQMAEDLGLIEGFDLALLEKALQRLRQPGSGLLKLAVNVSGASLNSDTYAETLLKLTSSAPIERRRLLIEVTETAALADLDGAARRLGALRRTGVQVCLDDFGVGSTSYEYIRSLPLDGVKIDGAFVRGIEDNERNRALVGHLVALCRSLDLFTVAEFVETEAAAAVLQDLGVDQGQGWLFGRAELEPRLAPARARPARREGALASWG